MTTGLLKVGVAALTGMMLAGAATAEVTPRLWGTSYAKVIGPSDVVLGFQQSPVHVSARLPRQLHCSRAAQSTVTQVPLAAAQRDPLAAAPVTVVLERRSCHGDWRDRWVDFVLRGPGSDILDVSFITADGQRLAGERIAVETGSGPIR